ncbi:MAG: hypothetical protein IPO90_06190 [Flavobacteriales bacterium]|nr:hypothetical protein [Flavobacteriales bacterium]MBL0043871.1 hypothetical protein [Flavobacteriales bacterium]
MTAAIDNDQVQRRSLALGVSITAHVLLLLFFIWYKIITPIPPFPEKEGGGSGYELALGFSELGMGDNSAPAAKQEAAPLPAEEAEVLTSEVDENNVVTPPKKDDKPKPDKPKTEKPKPTAEEIRKAKQDKIDALMNNKGTGDGGKGTSTTPGVAGSSTGTETGTGIGTGVGVYTGGGINIEGMGGRNVRNKPKLNTDFSRAGKVAMNIWVDRDGKVVRAEKNSVRSTIIDTNLEKIARDAALSTTFTPDFRANTGAEQKGVMIFVFEPK